MLKLNYRLIFFTVFLVVSCAAINSYGADTGVVVQPIEEAALDDLIHNRENKLIISFMAAWCGPCIDELPALNKMYRDYKDKGLKLVGISIDFKGAAAMQPIINKLKVEFPIYWYGEKAIQKFNLSAIPLLLVIKKGEIVERLPGLRSEEFLEKKITELLN
jgi:thiol-disulfide isomerase/thioredoxin